MKEEAQIQECSFMSYILVTTYSYICICVIQYFDDNNKKDTIKNK